MVTEKRIEELLNYFGETISDLPKSSDNDYSGVVYESKDLINAKKRALAFVMDEWNDAVTVPEIVYQIEEVLLDFICHQSDVIEKLVSALEKVYTYREEQKKYYDRITCAGLDDLRE